MTYQPMLTNAEIRKLADALEGPGDVTALAIAAEVVMREFAWLSAVLRHNWTVHQDGDEWAFSDPEGVERGRIYDVQARPRQSSP